MGAVAPFHRTMFDRCKVELAKRTQTVIRNSPKVVSVHVVAPTPRVKVPPNLAELIVEYVAQQDRPVSSAKLGKAVQRVGD